MNNPIPQIPTSPGVRAVGYVPIKDIDRRAVAIAAITDRTLHISPVWLAHASIPVFKQQAAIRSAVTVYQREVSFSTADILPDAPFAPALQLTDGSVIILVPEAGTAPDIQVAQTTSTPDGAPAVAVVSWRDVSTIPHFIIS